MQTLKPCAGTLRVDYTVKPLCCPHSVVVQAILTSLTQTLDHELPVSHAQQRLLVLGRHYLWDLGAPQQPTPGHPFSAHSATLPGTNHHAAVTETGSSTDSTVLPPGWHPEGQPSAAVTGATVALL
jgi:hypothetical protein